MELSGVGDLAGNVIAPNSSICFITATPDDVPPELTGAAGDNHVMLTSSESEATGVTIFSNYGTYPSTDLPAPLTVNASSSAGAQVTLALASLLDAEAGYTVSVWGAGDADGNLIPPNSSVTFDSGSGAGNWGHQSRSLIVLHVETHNSKGLSCADLE